MLHRGSRRRSLHVEQLEGRRLMAYDAQIIADLNPSVMQGHLNPTELTYVDGMVYFIGSTPTTGDELWRSDGTAAGTTIIADLNYGPASSRISSLTKVGNTLYFATSSGNIGLWKTDGTAEGTQRIYGDVAWNLTDVNGTLFFTASGSEGRELWKTDGTAAGTSRVADIVPGPSDADIKDFTNVGGTLFFTANDGVHGRELWKSDGTPEGTVRVTDLRAGGADAGIAELTSVGDTLFFRADDGQFGAELWRSDGTPAGTTRVADINPTGSGDPLHLTAIGSTLYFTATDGSRGYELWKSDGTESGTRLVRDINPGAGNSGPWQFVSFQGKVFFSARPSGYYDELWVTDGTSAGTYSVAKTSLIESPTVVGDTLYFRALENALGRTLWATDGTTLGTQRVSPFGMFAEEPRELIDAGGTLFFVARGIVNRDYPDGMELWKSDGTFEGTVQLSDINRPSDSIRQGAELNRIVDLHGVVYFGSTSGLWRTDGTASGTSFVAPILSKYLTRLGDLLISVGSAGPSGGVGLWASDGTPAGTTFIKQINSVANVSLVGDFTQAGSLLYFMADDGEFGKELWRTDGTAEGTFRLTDIRVGQADTNPSLLTNVNGQLLFVTGDGSGNSQIWRSNGTAEGTEPVFNATTPINELVAVNGQAYFAGYDPVASVELWKTDGTTEGTSRVADINKQLANGGQGPATLSSLPYRLMKYQDQLLFLATDGENGTRVWLSDGTELGTKPFDLLGNGDFGVYPGFITTVGDSLYFVADDRTVEYRYDTALWRVAKDELTPQKVISFQERGLSKWDQFTAINGKLFFVAYHPQHGNAIWSSDGTPEGTVLASDLLEFGDPEIRQLTKVGGELLFFARDDEFGLEPWHLVPTSPAMELSVQGEATYWENNSPVQLTQQVALTADATTTFGGGTLVVSILQRAGGKDRLAIGNEGLADNQIHVEGDEVFYGGVAIGRWTGGANRTALEIQFYEAATAESISQLIRNITFEVPGEDVLWGRRTIGYSLTNSLGEVATRTTTHVTALPRYEPTTIQLNREVIYREDQPWARLVTEFSLADADSPTFPGWQMNIVIAQGIQPGDRLDLLPSGQIQINDGKIMYNGYEIGRVDGGTSGEPLTIHFDRMPWFDNSKVVDAILRNVIMVADNENFDATQRVVEFTFVQARGIASNTFAVNVQTLRNVPPTISNVGANSSFQENEGPRLLSPFAIVTDSDSTNFNGGQLVVRFVSGAESTDRLFILSSGDVVIQANQVSFKGLVIATVSGGVGLDPLTITFNQRASAYRVQAVLRTLGYRNVSESPANSPRRIEITLSDGDGGTSSPTPKTVWIKPVNDAPKLNNALSPTLTSIDEDNRNSWGTPVWTLLPGASDIDVGAKRGLAVTAASGVAKGVWQYTLDGGKTWQALGPVSLSSAKLLPANGNLSRVRFLPNANFHGTFQLGFFAWDQTQGAAGGAWNISQATSRGGITAFSGTYETASLTVRSVNDAPLITLPSAPVGYSLNAPPVLLASTASVKDPDTANFAGGWLKVQISSGVDAGDRLSIGGPFKLVDGTLIWNNTTTIGEAQGGVGDTPLLIRLNANATLYRVEQLVRSLKFGTVGSNRPGMRTIAVSLSDGSITSNMAHLDVQTS